MMNDSWISAHEECRERPHHTLPPPQPQVQAHAVPGQPRLLRCSVVNLSPCQERNTILELEQNHQRLKNINQELRGRLEEIIEPREIEEDFLSICPNHRRQLQILAWDKNCPQMVEDPRTVQVLKHKMCPHEDHFMAKSQEELQQMRLSFERKKTSITEVWDGMTEVHMSLTDQAEGLLNLKKDIRDVLEEVEDIQMEILRDQVHCRSLATKISFDQEKKVPGSSRPPCSTKDDHRCSRKIWSFLTKVGLCLIICSVLFYLYVVNPTPYENLLPPIIARSTVWRIRSWCNPFLRVEVDDFLPF